MRFRNLSKLGLLVLSGTMVSGCGTFFAGNAGVSSQKGTSSSGISSAPRVTSQQSSGAKVSKTSSQVTNTVAGSAAGVGFVYPSFGIGVSGPEVLALNERLAELGYLPLQIAGGLSPQVTVQNLNSPPQVNFTWKYQNVPSELISLWNPTMYTTMTRAAVIAFERVNGIGIDGIAGPSVWKTLLSSQALADPHPYTYVLVQKDPAPETLKVWQAGQWVYQSVANTGIPQMSTTDGTFAVYLRFVSQTMTGTNPNGTHYSDPGVPYVNYFNGGDAIHGFIRASYGFPQSLGCVELPYSNAAQVWSLVHYGTLVTVTGHYIPPSPSSSATVSPSSQGSTAPKTPKPGTTGANKSSSSPSSSSNSSASAGSGQSNTNKGESKGSTKTTSTTPSANTVGSASSTNGNTGSGNSVTGNTSNGSSSGNATGNQPAPSAGGNTTSGNTTSNG